MAELVQKYPKRFPGFIASLPMNDPKGLLVEARRAIKDLGPSAFRYFPMSADGLWTNPRPCLSRPDG